MSVNLFSICDLSTWMYPNFSLGDQTVPYLSLTRQGSNLNYNAPSATLYTCQAWGANNQNVDHTGLLSNPVVQGLLLDYLAEANGAPPQPPPTPTTCGNGGVSIAGLPPASAVHRLTLSGVSDVKVSDGTADQFTDGAAVYQVNADSYVLLLARGKTYEVTFKGTDAPLFVEWVYTKWKKPQRATRYLDAQIAPGAQARFVLQDGALSELEYDSDGDSLYDAQLSATAKLAGKPARDVSPPTVTLSTTSARGGVRVLLTAHDKRSGIRAILYSLDGKHFEKYTGAFVVGKNVARVYALADDAAGNRSQRFELAVR